MKTQKAKTQKQTLPPRLPITITLGNEASAAVYNYQGRTGRDIGDIINGVLAAEVANVVAMLDGSESPDDSPEVMAAQVQDAARARLLECRVTELEGGTTQIVHLLSFELSAEAYAALTLLAKHDGYVSPKDAILGITLDNTKEFFAQVLGSDNDDTLAEWFGVKDES